MVTKAFSIRAATPADGGAAAEIIAAALAEHGLPFEPDGRDADVATFGAKSDVRDFVAEIDGSVVGVVSVGPQGDDAPTVAWLSKLFVDRRARGRGIGRALLQAAHDAARGAGFRTIGLRTRRIFREAVALYVADGYEGYEGYAGYNGYDGYERYESRQDPRVISPGDVVMYRKL